MKLLLENQEINNFQFKNDGPNLLGFDSLEEVFFDVFEIKNKNLQIVKEKIDVKNNLPVVNLNVDIDGILYEGIRFELTKDNIIRINKTSLTNKEVLIEKVKEVEPVVEETIIEIPKKVAPKLKPVNKNKLNAESKKALITNLIKENSKEILKHLLSDNSNDKEFYKFFEKYNENFHKQYVELTEKIARRECLRAMESGGGTNALQLAHGGTINGDLAVTGKITGKIENVVSKKSFLIGNGVNDTYTIHHNFNSFEVTISVYNNETKELVFPYIKILSENEVSLNFSSAIPANSYKAIIIG